MNFLEKATIPHIVFFQDNLTQKRILAEHIYSLENEEILFIAIAAFSHPSVIAGITTNQIEFFVKNAPMNYKNELAKSLNIDYRMKEVFEIAKAMDEDLGEGLMQNQKRIKSVQQYISDNWAVFQF